MKRKRSFLALASILLFSALLMLVGCVFPGTGTIHVRNLLSGDKQITAIYIYPQGSGDKGSDKLSGVLDYGELDVELGVAPGNWTVECEVDGGPAAAFKDITIEEGVIDVVWMYDNDIVL
jgi:hypothetical protein